MSMKIRLRIEILEHSKAGKMKQEELQHLEDERMQELVEKVKTMHPDEAELWAAIDKSRSLESSENMEDIEEYVETTKFVLRELGRLRAEAAQPSK